MQATMTPSKKADNAANIIVNSMKKFSDVIAASRSSAVTVCPSFKKAQLGSAGSRLNSRIVTEMSSTVSNNSIGVKDLLMLGLIRLCCTDVISVPCSDC